MIEFVDVNKKFGEYHIIKNLSLTIEKGKITVLIGSSGCGKTTTLKMINKLILPASGKIYIDGEDISQKDTIKLRRNIGYVIQQTGLFPHMNVKENIELIAKIENIDKNKINARTKELMKIINLDYETFSERYPLELSGGQQPQLSELLYLGSVEQPLRTGDFADVNWFTGGDGRGAVYTIRRDCCWAHYQVVRLAV